MPGLFFTGLMLTGRRQFTCSIHCSPSNSSLKKFLWDLYQRSETLPSGNKACTWPTRIFGLPRVLPSSINATNWATFMLVLTGGCTRRVWLVSVLSVVPGFKMMSWAYSLATDTACSFLWFAIRRSYVFSAWFLECRKAAAREALRASEQSLSNKIHQIRHWISNWHSWKFLFNYLLKKKKLYM